jgi:hypothetical protein
MNKHYTHRVTFEVTDAQYNKLKLHLEHGMLKRVFSVIVDDAIVMLDEFGPYFVLAMLSREVSYRRMMQDYMRQAGDEC